MGKARHLLVVLGLAALIATAFSNAPQSGMVLDNEFVIQGDPRLRAATWTNIQLIFTQDYWYPKGVGRLYRPLTTLSFLSTPGGRLGSRRPADLHSKHRGRHLLLGWAAVIPPLIAIAWWRSQLFAELALPPMAFVDNPLRGADAVASKLTAIR